MFSYNRDFEEQDEYCPHCDNHFVLPAKTKEEPKLMIGFEGSSDMIRDDRQKARTVDPMDKAELFGFGHNR
jgi:hypothetical protein